MLCPHCQAPNTDDARFCGACGKATQSTEPISDPNLGPAPALIGRVIAGRYRILAKLGEGGMGAVFQAEQISLKRTVAIKLLRPDVSASPLLLRRFNAEAEAVAKLRHPNTVNIYDFGQDTDGTLFIAMEMIEGRSLRTVIHREAPLPVRRALAIASQVAASLADAHGKTIIHRDLKPDNVMLSDRGRAKDNVTVLDFGIAKLRDDTRGTQQQMTQAGDMLGTPQYMAPEQIRGEPIDGRTDIYALGGMIYEMITARLPYEGPTVMALLSKHLLEQAPPPSQRRPELGIPPAVDDLVMRAMEKDPNARPATMEDYGERIAAVLASLPADPQRSGVIGLPTPHADTPPAYSVASGFAPHTAPPPGPAMPPPAGAPGTPPPTGLPGTARGFAPNIAPPSGGTPGVAPPPGGPSGFTPPPGPYAGPPPGAPYAHGPQAAPYSHGPGPARGGSKLIWVLVAVLLCGAAGAGLYFATRGGGGKGPADAREEAEEDHDRDRPDPDRPDPDRREPDKWDRKPDAAVREPDDGDDGDDHDPDDPEASNGSGAHGTSGSAAPHAPRAPHAPHAPALPGTAVDVGQGVKIIAPPGMTAQRQSGGVVIGDVRSLAIIAGPITEKTNDPDALARSYAKTTGLQVISSQVLQVAGARRKVYALRGTINGVQVDHIGVSLTGSGYRVAVIVHMVEAAMTNNPALIKTAEEILTRRIVVPSDR